MRQRWMNWSPCSPPSSFATMSSIASISKPGESASSSFYRHQQTVAA
eukprot:CAMPEP_0197065376 /NCGR_PEP_ID=MMETSP1384-20130603/166581_1 /TAXON_ID=29189 /ORGANISM="Ammonia sp." /LENGTH=46 /DNA_ID= /DNA_START= /DNA_END= /DNA_ORIENTATION=